MKRQELFVLIFIAAPSLLPKRKVLFLFLPSLTFKPKPFLITGGIEYQYLHCNPVHVHT